MEKIFVAARFRPCNESESKINEQRLWKINKNNNSIVFNEAADHSKNNKLPKKEYKFTSVFDHSDSTLHIYTILIRPLILSTLEGINCTVFTYGQTGSGKTFTMFGPDGLILLSMKEIFDRIERNYIKTEANTNPTAFGEFYSFEPKMTEDYEYSVRATFFEVYNEKVIDLMGGKGLGEREVKDWGDFMEILKEGQGRKNSGRSLINHVSSRSHTILKLTIRKTTVNENTTNKVITQSSLTFVDLAGNERIDLSSDLNPNLIKQRNETKHINKSLFHLNYVISLLSTRKKKGFVPYRNSLLTKLLRSSLGGNARTCIVLCLHPGKMFVGNSLNSMRFGMKAKMIVNKISKNIFNDAVKTIDDLNSSVSNESVLTFDEHVGLDFSSGNKRYSINATPNKNIQLNYEIKELMRNFEKYTQINGKVSLLHPQFYKNFYIKVIAFNEIRNENLKQLAKISKQKTKIVKLKKTLLVKERENFFHLMNENKKLNQMVNFYQNKNDYGLQRLNIETLEMLDNNSMQMLAKIKEQKILVKHNINSYSQTLSELKKPKTKINYFNDDFYILNTTQIINIGQFNGLKRKSQNKRRNSYEPYLTEREGLSYYRRTRSLSNKNPKKKEKENQVDIERIFDEMLLMRECILDDLEKIAQENSLNF